MWFFDEINHPVNKSRKTKVQTTSAQSGTMRKIAKKTPPNMSKGKLSKTTASFTEGGQLMKMAVDSHNEEFFQNSSEESDDEIVLSQQMGTEHQDQLDPPSDESSSESEEEEGVISNCDELPHSQLGAVAMNISVGDQVQQIDQEMQQGIIDLHDKMEAQGLHGAMQLMEQLFDKKPGEDTSKSQSLRRNCVRIFKIFNCLTLMKTGRLT